MEYSLVEFTKVLPNLYEEYTRSKYYKGYLELLDRLPAKAVRFGCLDLEDLCAIVDWGGTQHGLKRRLREHNTDWEVRVKTADAIRYFEKPAWALGALLDLEHLGLTYASKTLLFMNPSQYAALDLWIRRGLIHLLPSIRDADRTSMIRGYSRFLEICRELHQGVEEPGPGPWGEWRVADIQQAVFQFAQNGGVILG